METRKNPRLHISETAKFNINVGLSHQFDIAKKEIKAKVLDVSVGGIGLLSEYFVPVGAIINLEFRVGQNSIKTNAEIRSAVSGGKGITRLGVKFSGLSKEQLKILENFIKEGERRTTPRLNIT